MDKDSKKDNKNTTKDSRLEIRISKDAKEILKKKAKKRNLSLADYLIDCGLNGKKEAKSALDIIQCVVTLEEIGNHIRNKYGDKDIYIERTLDELWEKLM